MEEIHITDHDTFFNINGELISTSKMKSTSKVCDKIKINNNYYDIIDMGNNICCDGCYFLNNGYCSVVGLPCASHEREDNHNIIFKLIIERSQRNFNGLLTTEDLKAKLGYRWK